MYLEDPVKASKLVQDLQISLVIDFDCYLNLIMTSFRLMV